MKRIPTLFFAITIIFSGHAYAEMKPAIHVFVALCDNDSQGIVPVPKTLGNGDDPANNLYWGALYGVKTFFGKSSHWERVGRKTPVNSTILDRVIFKHKTSGTYLVADAYRGREIKKAVENFYSSAAGQKPLILLKDGAEIGIYGNAAMVCYIGHNGLMDFTVTPPSTSSQRSNTPAAIVLACKSRPYFQPTLESYGCSPLLLTTGFMAPEAYTLEAAINVWIKNKDPDQMKEAAAQAYNKYQKCGLTGARRLFFSTKTR